MDGKNTSDILEFVTNVIPKISQPGDQFAIFRLGFRDAPGDKDGYNGGKVLNHDSPTLNAPSIEVTPSPKPNLTPRPILTTPAPPAITPGRVYLDFPITQTAYHETIIALDRIATQIYAEDVRAQTEIRIQNACAQSIWERRNGTQNASWESTKDVAKSSYTTQVAATLIPFKTQATRLSTPYTNFSFR